MSENLPIAYLARHGETAWSLTGQHTGLTDLPLTERGELNAARLGVRLKGLTFVRRLPALCGARPGPANWPASELWPKSTRTWSNGTTVNMRVAPQPRFARKDRTGNCFAMAVQGVNRRIKSPHGLTRW